MTGIIYAVISYDVTNSAKGEVAFCHPDFESSNALQCPVKYSQTLPLSLVFSFYRFKILRSMPLLSTVFIVIVPVLFCSQQIVKNTLIPLWPSYSVEYQETHTTTVINQTISTSTAEYATVVNTTVWYMSPLMDNDTKIVAPTSYQTMEFQHQTVLSTDRANVTHTDYENNGLPFL